MIDLEFGAVGWEELSKREPIVIVYVILGKHENMLQKKKTMVGFLKWKRLRRRFCSSVGMVDSSWDSDSECDYEGKVLCDLLDIKIIIIRDIIRLYYRRYMWLNC